MHLVHVDTAAEWRGGQVLVHTLVERLAALGLRQTVVCPAEGRLSGEVAALGIPTVAIPAGWSVRTPWIISRVGGDLHLAHTSHGHGCAALLPTPLVVHRWVDFPPSGGLKYRRPQRLIAISDAVGQVLRGRGLSNVEVVLPGVRLRPPSPPAQDAPTVLALGARVPHKGHGILSEAAALLPGIDVGVAGPGEESWPRLRYLGQREDVGALLAGARVLAHPSITEGLGVAVVEAMGAGLPVVVSDAGGLPEVVGPTGWVVPRGDPEALARAIRAVLAGDHPDPAEARARVIRLFDPDAQAARCLEIYRAVLEAG